MIDGLLENIFRVKSVLDAVILVVGLATLLALVLVFALSLRLREREIATIFKLGCSRATIARLLGAEVLIIAAISATICAGFLLLVHQKEEQLVRWLVL